MITSDTVTDSIRVAKSFEISSGSRGKDATLVSVDHTPLIDLAINNLKTARPFLLRKRSRVGLVKHPWVSFR